MPLAAFAQDTADKEEFKSAYTKIDDLEGCVTITQYEVGADLSCAGYKGYGILLSDIDARNSVFYGYVGEWYAEGAYESFESFNSINDTVEWRLKDDVPFAVVQRWFIEAASGEEADRGQVLVVSRVAQAGDGNGCVVGYVDALENENANELAREIADTMAVDFRCRIDEPMFHGEEGVAAGFPVRSFGP